VTQTDWILRAHRIEVRAAAIRAALRSVDPWAAAYLAALEQEAIRAIQRR